MHVRHSIIRYKKLLLFKLHTKVIKSNLPLFSRTLKEKRQCTFSHCH